ncbi:hypothetical protein [Paenimyroides aestuarii]|uniref:Uncharacterized protein n=1 Tax=Paenimyroides aestuarii TaxID=2968490 RepID=A0ABY5NQN9_9FLAO|nr:hypothetical protein [Paenimyroides aestuarii]UUV20873.1 hypothetical protein NPX36_11160 [Paenimyroides aestuarii]
MKINLSIGSVLFLLLLNSCVGNTEEYGKKPLNLDQFNFDLNIEKFFQNEDIFRGNSDFNVSVNEEWISQDSIDMGYINYSTGSMSQDRPLAKFAGVSFESLGIITDWEDEKAIMAYANTSYATPQNITSILDKLIKDFGNPELHPEGFRGEGVNFKFIEKSKIITFSLPINYALPEPERNYGNSYYDAPSEPKQIYLTDEIYAEMKKIMADDEEMNCYLFITTPSFDAALQAANMFSGDLTHYR